MHGRGACGRRDGPAFGSPAGAAARGTAAQPARDVGRDDHIAGIDTDSDELDVSFAIPDEASSGDDLHVTLMVHYVEAVAWGTEYSNDNHMVSVEQGVTVRGRTTSVLPRIAKALLRLHRGASCSRRA